LPAQSSERMSQGPELGRSYTRRQIHRLVGGGSLRSFLPGRDGRILAACIVPELNLRAPFKLDIARGPRIVAASELAARTRPVLPVFLKRSPRAWQYVGRFRVGRFSRSRAAVREASGRRADAIGILYLEETP